MEESRILKSLPKGVALTEEIIANLQASAIYQMLDILTEPERLKACSVPELISGITRLLKLVDGERKRPIIQAISEKLSGVDLREIVTSEVFFGSPPADSSQESPTLNQPEPHEPK